MKPRGRVFAPIWCATSLLFLLAVHLTRPAIILALATASASGSARPTVVVTGATGRVGSRLVRALLREDAPNVDVVALVRDAAKARSMFALPSASPGDDEGEEGTAPLPPSLSVLEADYGDASAVEAALAEAAEKCGGGESSPLRLFLACGNVPNQPQLELNVARAACDRGADFCVKLSTASPLLEDGSESTTHGKKKEGSMGYGHSAVEAVLRKELSDRGMKAAILRPNIFMQQIADPGLFGLDDLRDSDQASHPFAERGVSMIDCEDVAACAAAMLSGDANTKPAETFGGKVFDLTGPEAVELGNGSVFEQALSSVRPRPVRIEPCTVSDRLEACGIPPGPGSDSLHSFLDTIGSYSDVTDTVPTLLGRPARSARDFILDNSVPFLPRKFTRLVGTRRSESFREAARVAEASLDDEIEALAEDEILIRVRAAGVNGGADTFDCTRAAEDARDFPLGHEGAGIVVAAGKGAERFRPGDVAVFVGSGGYGEYIKVKERMCARGDLSPDASPEELAALRISALTALVDGAGGAGEHGRD
uniref:NAD(P)-binding domain-containing protein n=1 Tax=Odontella aurita TaxID=265563 RepID=A0A7S4N6D2_9STRA|mmetsp:Transcript_4925/g.14040  ORF Transcript_4925/g.14040 Transcript_4925/m.14040 type:complete len:538 (+) Transcript_4925:162-1775(+)